MDVKSIQSVKESTELAVGFAGAVTEVTDNLHYLEHQKLDIEKI